MKKLLVLFVMACGIYGVNAQDQRSGKSQKSEESGAAQNQDVPEELSASMSQMFPGIDAENIDWETEDFFYKAEFEKNNNSHEVRFDRNGNLVYRESDVNKEAIPSEVKSSLSKEYGKNVEIEEARLLETPESTLYKLEIKSGGEKMEVYTDKQGKIVDSEKGKEKSKAKNQKSKKNQETEKNGRMK